MEEVHSIWQRQRGSHGREEDLEEQRFRSMNIFSTDRL